jgi:hypothetical protein
MSRELFGGAVTANVPRDFIDASQFRPVPDTQEVFIDDASGATVIVELLERVDHVPDAEAAAFHFEEVARQNRASASVVVVANEPGRHPETGDFVQELLGRQKIAKFAEGDESANDVAVFLGLRRLPAPHNTDVLVTVSYAFDVAPTSSDARVQRQRPLSPEEVRQLGESVFQSLKIVDYGLFAVEGGANGDGDDNS